MLLYSDSYLRDTLLVHTPEQDGPGNAARVFPLKEKRLGLSVHETEDLGVTADIELALFPPNYPSAVCSIELILTRHRF